MERLQHILLFRELEFPLKDIKAIINSPDFDRSKALEQQIELLRLKKEHIENLMNFALGIKLLGVKHMDFKAFVNRGRAIHVIPCLKKQVILPKSIKII